MSIYSMASLFSSSPSTHSLQYHFSRPNTTLAHKPYHDHHQYSLLSFKLDKKYRNLLFRSVSDNNEEASAAAISTATEEPAASVVVKEKSLSSNGFAPNKPEVEVEGVKFPVLEVKFEDPRWVNGTWNMLKFQKDGKTDWDALIDAEARRRKWLESNPESSNNDKPVMFDTSIIPWWAWIKRFHLPEAELLNGRAAMVGFFMAYFVDGLTGVGLVDQMDNFFCKTLLFIAVAGVLLIRKNEDFDKLKMLLEETTFYDKQWQATWKDETSSNSKNKQ